MPGLREQAALDAQAILEDDSGFAWPFTLTSPQGVAAELKGFTTDVGQTIDPDTGQAVAGRRASVAVSLRSLPVLPVVTADSDRKPWIVRFLNILGVGTAWKIIEVLPDRALGVGVFLLEVYQQAVVVMNASVLTLPRLLLSGSFTPAVALGGVMALPALLLAGSFAPAVELGGTLPLPQLQLAGSFAPVVELGGTLPLPQLQLAGSFAPVVELGGTLPLPQLQLAGSFAPVVELGGTLPLPQLQLAGSFAPVVELGGTVPLPQLQLAGSFTPAVSFAASTLPLPSLQLAGSFTPAVSFAASTLPLPSLQLAGSFTPAVSFAAATLPLPSLQLAGSFAPAVSMAASALTLPSLQLAGSFTPAVSFAASTLTLPSLQLAGGFTVSTSPVSSWLRLAASTINAGEYDTIANVLVPSNPTNQVGAVRKPAAGTSTNGLPVCVWDGTDVLVWPVVASNNATDAWGFGVWIKPTSNITSRQRIIKCTFPGSAGRFICDLVGGGFLFQCYLPGGVNGRQWTTEGIPGGGAIASTWQFLRFQFNGAGGSDAACIKVFVNEIEILTRVFFNVGAGGAMTALNAGSGYMTIGAHDDTDAPGQPLLNGTLTGPNWLIFNAVPTAAQGLALMGFEQPT